jgi:hypothetical protein
LKGKIEKKIKFTEEFKKNKYQFPMNSMMMDEIIKKN